ncbi:MAG: phosphatidate cytidylyltransferase [Thermomicrobium sp.]|nr:phosphatidate cytidylyltransferase [Thermomicrobium sp.]MCS7246510.1 phosphatidate cytidylyltransferase [Thermomicrobium sp.]MDW7982729.1 phosphatidate cytidylyltransferase [Thermomicrobium sp.]
MRQRTLSATLIFVVTVVPLVLGTWALFALLVAVLLQGARELARGFSRLTEQPVSSTSIAVAGLLLLGGSLVPFPAITLVAVVASCVVPLGWHLDSANVRDGLLRGTFASFSALYLGTPLATAVLLRSLEGTTAAPWLQRLAQALGHERTALGLAWLAWALSVTWLTDTAAYLVGRRFGRRKFAPRLSPGKTWEGALAGVGTGALAGWLGIMVFGIPLSPLPGLLAGAACATLGELGDLAESFLKRGLGLKDFGRSIPGHGGVLDRIDALLLTVPATLLLATLLTRGTP